jgi:catechol 2,3-dioxygenase-like lactoylglutathione lyase family enzyme
VIRVTRFDHVHVAVSNLDRALRFYEEAFGAKESFRVDDLVFVKLDGGAGVIALDARPEDRRNPSHIGLTLADDEDLDVAIQAVERAGGHLVERSEHAPGIPYAYVADPDGSVFEL